MCIYKGCSPSGHFASHLRLHSPSFSTKVPASLQREKKRRDIWAESGPRNDVAPIDFSNDLVGNQATTPCYHRLQKSTATCDTSGLTRTAKHNARTFVCKKNRGSSNATHPFLWRQVPVHRISGNQICHHFGLRPPAHVAHTTQRRCLTFGRAPDRYLFIRSAKTSPHCDTELARDHNIERGWTHRPCSPTSFPAGARARK